MGEKGRLRALVVAGEVDPSLDLHVVHTPTLAGALVLLSGEHAFEVVLLGVEATAGRALEAIGSIKAKAPAIPVVLLPRQRTEHLQIAIEVATRNPRMAAANAQRVWTLLPNYLARRAQDVTELQRALEQADFETIARIGHSLRGNGTSFAFPEVSAIGEAVEAAALEMSEARAREGIARLRECLGPPSS
jgi:HPt (histidine-containing phosphotransfer) domain-containing protein